MARFASSSQAALLAGLTAACATLESGPPPAGERFETCDDPAAQASLQRANELIASGDRAAAWPLLRRFIAACPDHAAGHLLCLETARAIGPAQVDELRAHYESRRGDGSPLPAFLLARLADYEATRLDLLRESLAADRSFYYAYLDLARQQRRLERPQRALAPLRDALRARPTFVTARLELGEVLVELGRYGEAEVEYANYRRARPGDRAAAKAHARLLIYDLDRAHIAEDIVEQLQREDPDDLEVWLDLASVHWKMGRPDEALALYHRVLQIDPHQSFAVLNLGNLYYEVLARGTEEDKRAAWSKARRAYRYFLNMQRTDTAYDLWDYYLSVPYRIKQIDALLGEEPPGPARLSDF